MAQDKRRVVLDCSSEYFEEQLRVISRKKPSDYNKIKHLMDAFMAKLEKHTWGSFLSWSGVSRHNQKNEDQLQSVRLSKKSRLDVYVEEQEDKVVLLAHPKAAQIVFVWSVRGRR